MRHQLGRNVLSTNTSRYVNSTNGVHHVAFASLEQNVQVRIKDVRPTFLVVYRKWLLNASILALPLYRFGQQQNCMIYS